MQARRGRTTTNNMATRWRRRRMCVLIAGGSTPAALRTVSAKGAFLETNARPELGRRVELQHPDAGSIDAVVVSLSQDGVGVDFECCEHSVSFALAAIAADMSRPAL